MASRATGELPTPRPIGQPNAAQSRRSSAMIYVISTHIAGTVLVEDDCSRV